MAAVQPIRQQSYEAVYALLREAVLRKQCVSADYKGYHRLLCPQIIGHNQHGAPHALCYQYGGESASGLKPKLSPDNWRCIAVDKLKNVKLIDDRWFTPAVHSQEQTCITEVDLDANKPDADKPDDKL